MKLKDCTKAELIFVIKRLQMYSLSDGHFIQLALRDVEEEREARRTCLPRLTPSCGRPGRWT